MSGQPTEKDNLDACSLEELMHTARLAEQTERYNDMVGCMKKIVVTKEGPLKSEERNLLSVAFKNVVGTRRASWRTMSNLAKKEDPTNRKELTENYKAMIEKELSDCCHEVVELLDKHLIPKAEDPESKVFYLKMKGDYYRYLAEVTPESGCRKSSEEAYNLALLVSKEEMEATNPIRLGLALNFSVFYYEIAKDRKKACDLAKCAFDEGAAALEKEGEKDKDCRGSHSDSELIMQLLRDNLGLWLSDASDAGELDDDDCGDDDDQKKQQQKEQQKE